MPAHKYNQFNGLIMNNKAKFVIKYSRIRNY